MMMTIMDNRRMADHTRSARKQFLRNCWGSMVYRPVSKPDFFTLKSFFMATNKINRNRVQTDPAFERTRENLAEFGNAGKGVKTIRSAFRDMLILTSDTKVGTRLQRLAMRIVHTDPVNDRGQRTVAKGDLNILNGFNFNSRNSFGETLYIRPVVQVDRATGAITITIPEFVPKVRIAATPGASHFQIVAAAAAIDFEKEKYDVALVETASLPWSKQKTAANSLSLQLPPNSNLPIVVAMGVTFEQEVNSKLYLLNSSAFNAAAIVHVDMPVAGGA
jgi:hypothetical protein